VSADEAIGIKPSRKIAAKRVRNSNEGLGNLRHGFEQLIFVFMKDKGNVVKTRGNAEKESEVKVLRNIQE
jgi:hypothetical protein